MMAGHQAAISSYHPRAITHLSRRRVGAHLHHRRGEREEVLDTAAVGELLRAERVVLRLELPQTLALLVEYRVRRIESALQIGNLRPTHGRWKGTADRDG